MYIHLLSILCYLFIYLIASEFAQITSSWHVSIVTFAFNYVLTLTFSSFHSSSRNLRCIFYYRLKICDGLHYRFIVTSDHQYAAFPPVWNFLQTGSSTMLKSHKLSSRSKYVFCRTWMWSNLHKNQLKSALHMLNT